MSASTRWISRLTLRGETPYWAAIPSFLAVEHDTVIKTVGVLVLSQGAAVGVFVQPFQDFLDLLFRSGTTEVTYQF